MFEAVTAAWEFIDRLVPGVTAIGVLITAYCSFRLMQNDGKRMRRRNPTFELHRSSSRNPRYPGWQEWTLTGRNHESVAIEVVAVHLPWFARGSVVSVIDYGVTNMDLPKTLTPSRAAEIGLTIQPRGTPERPGITGDTLNELIFTKGVNSARDLRFDWHWTDGQR